MIVNSKIKHKDKTMLRVIRNLVLDFNFYFLTAYMRKYTILHRVQHQHRVQHKIHLSKKSFMTDNLQQ